MIIDELKKVSEKYGQPRKTEIIYQSALIEPEEDEDEEDEDLDDLDFGDDFDAIPETQRWISGPVSLSIRTQPIGSLSIQFR